MENYSSENDKGFGVTGYQIGDDYIILMFKHRYKYKYSYRSCGQEHVENMKDLARQQKGLTTYKNQHNPAYEWKVDMGGRAAA